MTDSMTTSTDTSAPAADTRREGLRLRRLAATLIDVLFLAPTALFIMLATGIVESAEAWVMPQPLIRLPALVAGTYLLLNGYLLFSAGQTLGKRITGLRICSLSGGRLGAGRMLIRLYATVLIILIPALLFDPVFLPGLYLLDVLFIFGSAQRCLHDYLAGSRVVRVVG